MHCFKAHDFSETSSFFSFLWLKVFFFLPLFRHHQISNAVTEVLGLIAIFFCFIFHHINAKRVIILSKLSNYFVK